MTLIRFDPVYIVHFKCNKRSIESYKNLNRFVRHLYHDLGLKKVIDMDHIKRHYYGSHQHLNHKFIVPLGPDPWWQQLPDGQIPIAEDLKNFLLEVATGERDLEMARQNVCSYLNFVPTQAFSRIDRLANKRISCQDLSHFMIENSVNHITDSEF
jgi:hypothetical protein